MRAMLELEGVSSGYGESVVVDDVSIALGEGECVALLGRNGVGKTTLLSTVMGQARLHRGALRFRGRDLARIATPDRARLGLGWVPQERAVWRSLTVREHLSAVARPGSWTPERAFALFPRLAERSHHRGFQLSGGEQQMLAIARALVTNPSLILLDEPLEGLAPLIVKDLVAVLRGLAGAGAMTILLVEQHARIALSLATRALVMDRGRLVLDRAADQLAEPELERWLSAA
jgi:branched-chain amino acid transport system ATP-binding protein